MLWRHSVLITVHPELALAIALRRDPDRACYMTQTLDVRVFTARRSDNKMRWTASANRSGTWEPEDAIP